MVRTDRQRDESLHTENFRYRVVLETALMCAATRRLSNIKRQSTSRPERCEVMLARKP
jgi:hypothetical protein